MRKFSVLLFVIIFFLPVLVYGFTAKNVPGRISKDISAFVKSQKDSNGLLKIRTVLSKASSRLFAKSLVLNTSNGLFPEPFGAKGVVESVDLDNRIIFLKDATYYMETTKETYTSDLQVYVDDLTIFTKDVDQEGSLSSINAGDVIVCRGVVNFTTKSIQNAHEIYQGLLISPTAQASLVFSAPISNYNSTSKYFEFTYICPPPFLGAGEPQALTIKVTVSPETRVFIIKKGETTLPTDFKLGEIPDFVKNGSMMNGIFVVNQDLTAVTNTLYFVEQ